MAEKVVSPGVFTNEIDQTFLPAAIGDIGAAVIGPTVKGPAMVPTVVTSFSEYQQIFGDTFKSGSNYYSYLTSLTARNYLRHAGRLTVVRILDGTYSNASASIGSGVGTIDGTASASFHVVGNPTGSVAGLSDEVQIGGVHFTFVSESQGKYHDSNQVFVEFGHGDTVAGSPEATWSNEASTAAQETDAAWRQLRNVINNSASIHGLSISASYEGTNGITAAPATDYQGVFQITATKTGNYEYALATAGSTKFMGSQTVSASLDGGIGTSGVSSTAFNIHTLADGAIMNSNGGIMDSIAYGPSNNTLVSGSSDNLRWEVSTRNVNKGTFTLLVRRGDDTEKRKQILETWNNLSLDPMATNYIEKMIGSQKSSLSADGTYIQFTGDYPLKSKYIRVTDVTQTPVFLDENGDSNYPLAEELIPALGSGSFEGGHDGEGSSSEPDTFYNAIVNGGGANVQGFDIRDLTKAGGGSAYSEALGLLSNADEYDINLLLLPGVTNDNGSAIVNKALETCEDRGDCFVIADPVAYGDTQANAISAAETYDSNYGAMYWPWVQVPETSLGRNVWVPPSVVLGGIYAFNDKVAHPWFAPAGLNRGGIDTAIQAERKLTHANRDDMYESNLNPIATFPGQGVTVFGQKTMQKKASALDRVNVRRLMIKVKKFIASSSRFLVFEQNNSKTRGRFLNIVNPYLEQVQSNSGLNAFRVVMDETNNTPDVVDRNILYGQIFLQPTRTAEFIVLDFTIQPTGATFPE